MIPHRPLLTLILLLSSVQGAEPNPPIVDGAASAPRASAPSWFLEHLALEMQHGGRSVADNTAYRNSAEPFDAYGLEWRWGVGKRSLRGRLFGLIDGREAGDFWELRLFWHPGEGAVQLLQMGSDGTLGQGWMRPREAGQLELEQEFFAPDGSRRLVRHETRWLEGGSQRATSFEPAGKGWKVQRTYIWEPVAEGK